MKRWIAFVTALTALSASAARAQSIPSAVYGKWLVQGGSAAVELTPCYHPSRGPLCGRIVWLRDASNPDGKAVPSVDDVMDVLNADPALRKRKLLGTFGMYDFRAGNTPDSFEGGILYNPEDGRTYRAVVRLLPNGTLYLRGYIGLALFGRTQVWSRAADR